MKLNTNNLRIKWKIFAYVLAFCALLLAVLWLAQTVFLGDTYKYIRKQELQRVINYVEQNINSADLAYILNEVAASSDIFITFEDGETFKPMRPERDPNRRKLEIVTQTHTFTLTNGKNISITFNAIISPLDATVNTLRYQLFFITGTVLLLSIVLALLIARNISAPIESLNKAAKNLARGNYDANFRGRGFLEIRELSDTLNTAAAELSKTESLRRELLANISHDLRTPLSLIYSYAEVMHDFPDEISPEQTQIIMDEAKRLSTLVNDVLDISKLESGIQQLNAAPFNLTQTLKATTERIAALAKKDNYTIAFDHDRDVTIIADEVKITQAFYNLLINAINYSVNDKHITVIQTIDLGSVKIEVVDNGEGIAPENLPYIWDRYYKVDKKHKRAITGTGLGLSIVKKVIELHNGGYGVKSREGAGSVFWFSLKL